MKIVPARTDDFAEILVVWEKSVRATHHFLSEEDIESFKPLILSEFLPAVALFCLKDDSDRIHGFLGTSEENIEMLFLDPNSRGKGYGRMLLDFAIKDLSASSVDVNEQNPEALGFYEHMGFVVAARSPVDGMGKPFAILHMRLAHI
ncbi:GNAT family N-acetyltransferase [Oceanidesulfovibrio indonesiensis]|uniref:GNAT family N-acetyltransferase n=1 Tax=Oceanidesulfovibrio indonesiensis TaxID=54767 RepID=A0A7M3MB11_9BACT|nr:GNAT family N-acetyltransferase [Oceanidesulfovibrio indonesiensis]TVM15168.1 GNAT family N-acetyltransferase [Oceanidesulfovibrio indonesiensis]